MLSSLKSISWKKSPINLLLSERDLVIPHFNESKTSIPFKFRQVFFFFFFFWGGVFLFREVTICTFLLKHRVIQGSSSIIGYGLWNVEMAHWWTQYPQQWGRICISICWRKLILQQNSICFFFIWLQYRCLGQWGKQIHCNLMLKRGSYVLVLKVNQSTK